MRRRYDVACRVGTWQTRLDIRKVRRQWMLEKKEYVMQKLFLATLWAKLLIIAVNFENKTKVFRENVGLVL